MILSVGVPIEKDQRKFHQIKSGHILETKGKYNHIKCKIFLLLRHDVQVTKFVNLCYINSQSTTLFNVSH